MRDVGIESIGTYTGLAAVSARDVFAARGLDDRRMDNLMMDAKTVALPCEDAVTYAVNAAAPLLDRLGPRVRDSVEILLVATESGVDYSKSVAAWVHGRLGLGRRCRLMEIKQACDSGVSAVRMAASALRTEHGPGARALVIAADVPWVLRGDYIEPSQGAGAVAVLLGDEPAVASLRPLAGAHSFDVADFLRPKPEVYLWDVDESMTCYIECARGALADYCEVTEDPSAFHGFDYLAMHTPFPGMVRGTHRALMRGTQRCTPAAVDADFTRRVAPALRYPAQVGNIYAATTLLALTSVIDQADPYSGATVGMFSYGSGCSSQFCAVDLWPGARDHTPGTESALRARRTLDMAACDELLDVGGALEGGVREYRADLPSLREMVAGRSFDGPFLALSGVSDYRREYVWMED
ncbi:hydroxymethylglutaryl-CoA synthase family protein [Streptomyces sp. NPDC002520]